MRIATDRCSAHRQWLSDILRRSSEPVLATRAELEEYYVLDNSDSSAVSSHSSSSTSDDNDDDRPGGVAPELQVGGSLSVSVSIPLEGIGIDIGVDRDEVRFDPCHPHAN